MVELHGRVSAPGVIQLFGEYSAIFGEPVVAAAIDLNISVSVEPAEFDFFVVDGFKLDEQKHKYFDQVISKLWNRPPLQFSTLSQLPWVSGVGITSSLLAVLTTLLTSSKDDGKPNRIKLDDSKISKIACQAYKIENQINFPTSPIGTSTALAGGVVLLFDIPAGARWSVQDKNRTWYVHQLDVLENVPLVIGYLKQQNKQQFSKLHPRALFDTPIKSKPSKYSKPNKDDTISYSTSESIHQKLQRFVKKSGFAKDIIKNLGKNVRAGVQALNDGDLKKIGKLMYEQQNLITILGIYPEKLRTIAHVIEPESYGVMPTGTFGDAVIALTDQPEEVSNKIKDAGGETIITNVSKQGLNILT